MNKTDKYCNDGIGVEVGATRPGFTVRTIECWREIEPCMQGKLGMEAGGLIAIAELVLRIT